MKGQFMTKPKRKAVAKKSIPTPEQRKSAIEALLARRRERPRPPTLKVENDAITLNHEDDMIVAFKLMETLGSADANFQNGMIFQLANAGSNSGALDERSLNFMLSMVNGVKPQDEVEAMLAAQMAAVHNATMSSARRLNQADNIMQADSAERALNKLARTFTTQIEALKRYRTGGEQKVTVQHVNVHEGGQAIVGNVQGGGGLSQKSEPTP